MQGFQRWLAQFRQARTPLGDLSRLAATDPAWPDGPDRLPTYSDYMERIVEIRSSREGLEGDADQGHEQIDVPVALQADSRPVRAGQ